MIDASRRRAARARLVGRAEQVAAVREALERRPSTVVILGEPGVGKSRLVQDALAPLPASSMLIGGCFPQQNPFPLHPLVPALRPVASRLLRRPDLGTLSALRPLLPDIADRLPTSPPGWLHERHQLFQAARQLLHELGSIVLVIEDLHWADPTTIDFLHSLAADPAPELGLVLTCRDQEVAGRSWPPRLWSGLAARTSLLRLPLAALAPPEVAELIRELLGVPNVSEQFVEFMVTATAGNPFAIEELLELLVSRGDLAVREGVWQRRDVTALVVPSGVRDSVEERLGRLSPEARAAVEAVAVVGAPVPDELLRAAAELTQDAAALAAAEGTAVGLLIESAAGTCVMRHALARQAVYDSMAAPRRRILHARVGRWLAQQGPAAPPAELAAHFRVAGLTAEWRRHAEAAADEAAALFDDATAARLLLDVLHEPTSLERRVRLRLAVKLARTGLNGLAHHEAIGVLTRVLEEDDPPQEVWAELRFRLSLMLWQAGKRSEAYTEARCLIAGAAGDTTGLVARAMGTLAYPLLEHGHVDEHRNWADKAWQTASGVSDPMVQLAVAGDRAACLLYLGDPRAWAAVDEMPRDVSSVRARMLLASQLGNFAEAATLLGETAAAEQFLLASRDLVLAEPVSARYEANVGLVRLLLDWTTGRWDGLSERAQAFNVELADVDGEAVVVAAAVRELVAVASGRSNVGRLQAISSSTREAGALALSATSGAAASRLLLREGAVDRAVEVALESLVVVRRKGSWIWAADAAPVAVTALLRAGRPDPARELLADFAEGLRQVSAPGAWAALTVCQALVAAYDGHVEDAEANFSLACAQFSALPWPYPAALTRVAWGIWSARRVQSDGVGRMVQAMRELDGLGASTDAARVRARLRRLGLSVANPHRGGRRPLGSELSAREAEVVQFAATGHTNREIGELLSLSPRTVEHHVLRAMRKLGITSRRTLRAFVEQPSGSGHG